MRNRFSLQAVGLALVCAAGTTLAASPQGQKLPGPPQPITWTLSIEPAGTPLKAGSSLKAVVFAKIDEGWHVYAPDEANSGPRPVTITMTANPVFSQAGKMDAPEPEREMDEAFGQITASYTHEATFRLPVTIAAGTAPGMYPLKVEISSQACDGRMCLPPKIIKLEAQVRVVQ
jgi:DsbC/DsbD-like thiol-disulfide interchange protein